MWTKDALTSKAVQLCGDEAGAVLAGELRVQPEGSSQRWSPLLLRHVFDQSCGIFRLLGRIEVLVDRDGRQVGFVDFSLYEGAGEGDIRDADARELVLEAGLLPPASILEALSVWEGSVKDAPVRTYRALFAVVPPGASYDRAEVEINATAREVIAVRPIPREGEEGGREPG